LTTHFSKKKNRSPKIWVSVNFWRFFTKQKDWNLAIEFWEGTRYSRGINYVLSFVPLALVWGQKWWPTNLRTKILLSQWGHASCTLDAKDFFLLEGARHVSFSYFIFGKGDNYESFFSYFGSWVAFVLWHILCFCLVCKVVWMFKSSSILLTYAGESHGEIFCFAPNTRVKLLFWFSLQGSCGGPKRVLFFSLGTWIEQE
jgi:hypothetical protein